ncbi:hypothetical protein, partial [Collinsella sp. TF06-26]
MALKSQIDPFFFRLQTSPGNQLNPPATKSAYLLRLARHPQTQPRFMKNRRLSTCGFLFQDFSLLAAQRPALNH